jgi:small subunit ribosomal protein S18
MENTQSPTTPTLPATPARSALGGDARRARQPGAQKRTSRFLGPRPARVCPFCTQKVKYIDYKLGDQLRRYLTDHGKIKARRKIGTCAKHQRRLALAIKRARHIALLPYTTESTRGE